MRKTEFFVILGHFLPFHPPNNPENQNFKKLKKIQGDLIILLTCTINDNHMMYGSRDVEHKQNFFILDCLLPFYPPMDPENQNFEKAKKTTADIIILIIILQMCTINDNHMIYGS